MKEKLRISSAAFVLVLTAAVASVAVASEPNLLDPVQHPKFINPLPVPGVMEPEMVGGTHYEISTTQFEQWLGLVDPATGNPLLTTVWGYNGSYPGATIEARVNEPITVHWTNDLKDGAGAPLPHLLPVDTSVHWAAPPGWPATGVPIVTHLHGGHSESASDGLPEAWFTPGFSYTGEDWVQETYRYDNDQDPTTLWYHDHALGITRLNVYAGLAGFYLLRDDWEGSLNLPSGAYEIPIVIQDRMFTADGQLYYPSEAEEEGAPDPSVLPEFFGDFILVNGRAWPFLDVEPRKYRFRFLDGSDSRFFQMWFASGQAPIGPSFNQIGTDGGLLYSPVTMDKLVLGPGERADVIIDFTAFAGETLTLRNNARAPFPRGENVDSRTVGQLMQFRVSSEPVPDPSSLPMVLLPAPIEPLAPTAVRELMLFEGEDEYGRLLPQLGTAADGPLMWDDPTTETPFLDDVEIWSIINTTEDAHPIHLHLVRFQILSRQKFRSFEPGEPHGLKLIGRPMQPEPNERGWKDTALMFPGEVTKVIAKFDRAGAYVWHCHILSHEDHEMMRRFEVQASPGKVSGPLTGTDTKVPPTALARGTIPFALPPGAATIRVYNIQGRLVRQLEAGGGLERVFLWDGRGEGNRALPNGTYFYRLDAATGPQTGKVVLLK